MRGKSGEDVAPLPQGVVGDGPPPTGAATTTRDGENRNRRSGRGIPNLLLKL